MSSPNTQLAELRSYIGFTKDDAALLARFHAHAEPHFPAIADEFYAVIRRHPGAASVLRDEEQAARLHGSLQEWLGELLSGPVDDAYVGRHARIGQIHVRVGLPSRYMVMAMSRIRLSLQALASEFSLAPAEREPLATAISRMCDLDLAIMLESYEEDLVLGLELERRSRTDDQRALTSALGAGLAHAIRNPLNGASLHASVIDRAISRAVPVPPGVGEATGVLREELKRIADLVTDFLEFARPRPLARSEHDLNAIAEAVVLALRPDGQASRVSFEVERSAVPALASLDAERIQRGLTHIVRNALEATPDEGRVLIQVRKGRDAIELDVVDHGPGIADPLTPVFEAFFTTKPRGVGLSLAITRRIVSDHGGAVGFESVPGSTVFGVRIPIEPTLRASSMVVGPITDVGGGKQQKW